MFVFVCKLIIMFYAAIAGTVILMEGFTDLMNDEEPEYIDIGYFIQCLVMGIGLILSVVVVMIDMIVQAQ